MKKNMRNSLVLFVSIILSALIMAGCGGGGATAINDHASAVAMQSDGKIVAAGDSYNDSNGWSFALVRYNSNGSLDTTFGTGGKVLTNIGAGVRDIVIQGDGKIVAAGYSYVTPDNFVLVRYNSNGSLDTSFGSGGMVLTSMGGGVTALALQGDGRIVAAGYSHISYGYDFALARYDTNGTLDPAFGFGSGKVFTSGGMGRGAADVAIQTDGKILAAGGSYLARYNSDGTPDMAFGTGSGVVFAGSAYEQTGVAIQADGKILAAGSAYMGPGGYGLALTRYIGTDGFIDTPFASGGRTTIAAMSIYNLGTTSVVPQSNGNIVVAGCSQYQFVLARYDSTGFPDTSFASGGVIIATGGSYWSNDSVVRNIAVQSTDGKIVLVGSTYKDDASGYDFALARLNSDGSLDTGFGTGGKVTTGM